jgi:hypothetical protein
MGQQLSKYIELLVPAASGPREFSSCVPTCGDIRDKRVGFRIEGSNPIRWHKDLLLRNFEIFMGRVEELLNIKYPPSSITRFHRRDDVDDPKAFNDFCDQIDWAILGIAG